MPQEPPPPYPPQFLEGLRLLNDQDFFESHDVLEELWADIVGDERQFYQGLIQVAVALFHFSNGNLGGARKLYHSSYKYLQQYPSTYMGLDLENLLNDLQTCFKELIDADNTYPTDLVIDESLIPRVAMPAS
jgi:predicted metal-dependent hydrolase